MMRIGRTVLVALLGATAFAALAVPTRQPEESQFWNAANLRVQSAYAHFLAQLEYLRRADSRAVARTAERTAVQAGSLYIGPTPPRADVFATKVRSVASAEAARMPRRDTSVRIVIAFAIDTQPIVDAERLIPRPWPSSFTTDVFLPTREAPTTCTVVARAHRPAAFTPWDSTRFPWRGTVVLGPCAWYGAYGLPGRGIAAWLDSTQHAAILSDHRRTVTRSVSGRPVVVEQDGFPLGELADAVTVLACVTRRASACDSLLQRPIRFRYGYAREPFDVRTPGSVSRGRGLSAVENAHAGYVLAELERQLGPDAFLSFWKSDLSFPDAFAAARGVSLSAWFSRELAGTFTSYSPGPLPRTRTAIALLVLIPGAIAAGLWALRRREVFA